MTDASQATSKLSPRGQLVALTYFDHVERQIALAVTKASLLVAASALIVAAFVRAIIDIKIFVILDVGWIVLFAFGGALLLIGFTCALIAVVPHKTSGEPNALYYGWISVVSFEDYRAQFENEDRAASLDENLLRQVYGKSRWLRRMFVWTSWSIWCTILGTWFCVFVLASNGERLLESEKEKPSQARPATPVIPDLKTNK